MKRSGRLLWIVPALVLAFYGRALGRYFVSEDFLLVRFLADNPPWRDLAALFSAPWLEISVVKFYRPVSTLLYGLEIAAFGGNPVGYNVVHVLVHALNAVLVGLIARRLAGPDQRATAVAAALLFAVHPLHPNAVLFGASFATLFAASFLFGTMLAYLRFRESGARSSQVLALGLFALALGSYEAAVVFPAVLAASDHLTRGRSGARRHLALLPGYLPFLVLTGFYLVLRKSLFGVFVGGYEEQGRSLLNPQLGPLLRDLAASIHWLHVPIFDRSLEVPEVAVVGLLVLGAPLAWLSFRSRVDPKPLRLWLLSWLWILAALAPFAFRPSVPANGRYWYLAVAGVVLALSFLVRSARLRWAPVALVLVGVFWGVLLHESIGVHLQAGETARAVQRELLRAAGGSPTLRFLTGHPGFLMNEVGVPAAQVLRYGVWDSVHPPFVEAAVPVYPLPPLQGFELLPVLRGAPESRVEVWDDRLGEIRPAVLPSGPAPPELVVVAPAAGAAVDTLRDSLEVAVPPGRHARFRLIVLSRGNPVMIDLGPEAVQGGTLRAPFPDDFCRTMDRLYGGDLFWWIEARDAAGEVSGFTPLRSFRVAKR